MHAKYFLHLKFDAFSAKKEKGEGEEKKKAANLKCKLLWRIFGAKYIYTCIYII